MGERGERVRSQGQRDRCRRQDTEDFSQGSALFSSMLLQLLSLHTLPGCGRHLMADGLIKQQQWQQFAEHHGASPICQHLPGTSISVGRASQTQVTSPASYCLAVPAKASLRHPLGVAALAVQLVAHSPLSLTTQL